MTIMIAVARQISASATAMKIVSLL